MSQTANDLEYNERRARLDEHDEDVASIADDRPATIAECVIALVELYEKNWDIDAYTINCGDCDKFAIELIRIWTGTDKETDDAVVIWAEDLAGDEDLAEDLAGLHAFACIDGRYYDSECPEGVDDGRALPCLYRYFNRLPQG